MGGGQPFMYDAIAKESSNFPRKDFDPRAASRASYALQPQRHRHDGPLVTFNAHPE